MVQDHEYHPPEPLTAQEIEASVTTEAEAHNEAMIENDCQWAAEYEAETNHHAEGAMAGCGVQQANEPQDGTTSGGHPRDVSLAV